jgi:hypothetical protein
MKFFMPGIEDPDRPRKLTWDSRRRRDAKSSLQINGSQ